MFFDIGDEIYSNAIDKYRLVPLGEWIPSFSNFLQKGLSAVGGLTAGSPSRLFEWEGPPFSGVICYELSDGTLIVDAVSKGAQWVLSIANLDPYPEILQRQFLSIAQLRSIETARDVISVANTGPTSLIRSSGKVEEVLQPFQEEIGLVDLNLHQRRSFYSLFKEFPLGLILSVSFFWTLLVSRSARE